MNTNADVATSAFSNQPLINRSPVIFSQQTIANSSNLSAINQLKLNNRNLNNSNLNQFILNSPSSSNISKLKIQSLSPSHFN